MKIRSYLITLLSLWLVVSSWCMAAPLSLSANEKVTYLHPDILGSVMLVTEQGTTSSKARAYESYGTNLSVTTNVVGGELGFTGKSHFKDIGLSYFGARWYDDETGRFISIDPVDPNPIANVHTFNRYIYANNNPYKYVDPDGRAAETLWDGFNVGLGVASLGSNLYEGNYGWAAVDTLGIVTDGLATAVPFIPGGVGSIIKASRVGEEVLSHADEVADVAKTAEARAARDALAESASKLSNSKRPATVTAGYNTKTGEVAARACGGGKCAEDHVVDALGGNKADVRFTEAVRPRTGEQVPVCTRCEGNYGREPFPSGTTRFKSDE